jgi:hypothetical protein
MVGVVGVEEIVGCAGNLGNCKFCFPTILFIIPTGSGGLEAWTAFGRAHQPPLSRRPE